MKAEPRRKTHPGDESMNEAEMSRDLPPGRERDMWGAC